MNENELIETAKTLIRIPSTADDPEALRQALQVIARTIENRCPEATVEFFESNGIYSLLAYRSGQRPDTFHVLLNGHVDVVAGKPEQYDPQIRDGKLYGRGAYDMKTAALVLTDVFCEYVARVPYSLGLQIVTDEETAGHDGTEHQISQGTRADFVICGECGRSTGRYEIANEAKGTAIFDVEFTGSSAHGAYPWEGENAALQAASFLHRLHERFPTPQEATGETTVSVNSIISSGGSPTRIPDHAVAKIDARYIPDDPYFSSKERVTALMREIDPQATIKEFIDFAAPIYTDPDNPLLLRLKAAAEQVEQAPFSLVRRNGSSDGRFYGNVSNQACEFGIAGENQHGDNEYVPLQAIFNYRDTLRHFLASIPRP
jgi:succinyl-diaminopimelate desuccinylase